jgi:carbamoyl-phosphate synthase large subunit
MKILLTSARKRGYLVKYFKQAIGKDGEVWGADSSQYTPAFQYCDKTVLLPEMNEPDYADKVIQLCNDSYFRTSIASLFVDRLGFGG